MAVSVSDPEAQERLRSRFRREARAAARLHHPNVVTVFDYGTDAPLGLDYLVMELLQGEDLAARLERASPLPLVLGLKLLEEAGRGLAAGHHAGLVHRDVKPANLFLEQTSARGDLRVRVLDFGIAQITAEGEETLTHLTMFGSGPLSPSYASPEQLRGAGDLSPASDVFSLAVTGFQVLTGRRPFDRSQIERMAAGQSVPVPSVRELDPRIPVPVDRVLRRGMHPAAAERYADAGEFADVIAQAARESDLAEWVSGSRSPGADRTLTDAGQTETQQAFVAARGAARIDNPRGAAPVSPPQRFPAPASHQYQAAPKSFRERVPSAAELEGRTLRVAPDVLQSGNPRRPFTHGWLAFEILLRSEDGCMPFEEYRRRLFHPAPEIRALAEQIPGVPNAYQDLKHIRHDIRHGRVWVE
jgi:serine/threonine protein kinase